MSGNDNKSTDKTLLLTANHNYFVRQAISTFCGLVILTFIYAFIAIMCSSTIIEGGYGSRSVQLVWFLTFFIARIPSHRYCSDFQNNLFTRKGNRSGKRTCTKWSILVQEIDLNYYPYEPIVNDRFMFCLPNLHPTTPQDELPTSPTFHPFHTHSVWIEIVRNTFGVRRHRSWVNR